jgi:hypothetical protein
LNKVEPRHCVAARNLLSKDDWRLALADEVVPGGPKVPLVSKPSAFACRAERLARTRAGPHASMIRPTSSAESEGPHANSSKEMALIESSKVVWSNIFNAPGIDDAGRDVACVDEVAQPCSRVGVDLVVVGRHAPVPRFAPLAGGGGNCTPRRRIIWYMASREIPRSAASSMTVASPRE